ncbi:GntR family transcriptional regulator [Paenibacillus yanchengensis]|uniref:GntR family transcriptional regulator n=1 Tax=Paenibacillus yanchengensis TaxID=2035833 RepID=A0ABW4YJ47_9BACL
MLLQIDLQSEVPIYTQLVHNIIEGIARKELLPGEALPSVRSMAADLGINLHTVNKAYNILKQDGFVQVNRKQGAVIHPASFPLADEQYQLRLQEQMRPLIAEAICRGMSSEQFKVISEQIYSQFSIGEEKEDG